MISPTPKPISVHDAIDRLKLLASSHSSSMHQRGYAYTGAPSGVCKGACLDWIRRILNSQKLTYADKDTAKGKRQLARFGVTHTAYDTVASSLEVGILEAKERSANYKQLAEQNRERNESFFGFLMFWTPTDEELTESFDKTMALNKPIIDLAMTDKKDGTVVAIWPQFLEKWNSKNPGKKSNFNAIQVAGRPEALVGNLPSLVDQVFGDKDFSPGRCLMLGVSFESGAGHAFALHSDQAAAIHLFDPNLGVFHFTAEAKAKEALEYLLAVFYPSRNYVAKKVSIGIFYK